MISYLGQLRKTTLSQTRSTGEQTKGHLLVSSHLRVVCCAAQGGAEDFDVDEAGLKQSRPGFFQGPGF